MLARARRKLLLGLVAAFFASLFLLWLTGPANAQTANPAFEQRATQLADILASRGPPEDFFADSFLASIPASKISELSAALVAQNGNINGVEQVSAAGPFHGNVNIGYQRAVVSFTMTLSPDAPHKVIGLLITNVQVREDSAAKLGADILKLPGQAAFLVTRIDGPRGTPLLAVEPDRRLAIGSAFKLWILAEAARSVNAGKRRWSDVVPLRARSLPSGILQNWPRNAPITLHSLATLMISISDNTATDALLTTLGRTQVGAILPVVGHASPASTLPILSTTEAFALKVSRNADLRRTFELATPQNRLRLLENNVARLKAESISPAEIVSQPLAIQTVEWFASPRDMANTLNWLRANGGQTVLEILAVNPGIPEAQVARFSYVGYKGGSETGVISMNLVVRTRGGVWYAVTGSWNNPAAAISEAHFVGLFYRAVALIPD